MDGHFLIVAGAVVLFVMYAWTSCDAHNMRVQKRELATKNGRIMAAFYAQEAMLYRTRLELDMLRKLEERRIERAKRRAGQAQRRDKEGRFA